MSSTAKDLPAHIAKQLDIVAKNEHFTDDYQITHDAGSKAGDGFMGEMIAVTLSGHRQKAEAHGETEPHFLKLIVKCQPSDKVRLEQFQNAWVFNREVYAYNHILPLLERMQRDQGLNESNGFFAYPKCYFASFEQGKEFESAIIMEDLRESGFTLCDKSTYSPFENIKLVLEQLGRMHALSFVWRDKSPKVLDRFASELFEIFTPILRSKGFWPVFKSAYARTAKVMENEPYADIFQRMKERWINMYDAAFDYGRYKKFGVVTHGDFWINNMMFLIKDGIGQKVSLVDWQAAHIRSPALDISNFLFSVTDSDDRAKHMDTYLDIYYTNLATTMRAFGSDPDRHFSRADFEQQLRENAFYGVLNAAHLLAALVCESSGISDMSALAAETTEKSSSDGTDDEVHLVRLNRQSEVVYRKRYNDLMKDADRYGWLDILRTL